MLVSVSILCFLIYYALWHWKRRRMYQLASQIKGPFAWPLIGSAHSFMFISDFSKIMLQIGGTYPGLGKMWFAHYLFYFTTDAAIAQNILNNQNSMNKMSIFYKSIAKVWGNGLITADVNLWRKHRKIITPAINQKFFDSHVTVFTEKASILASNLAESSEKAPVNLFKYVNECTLDMILESAMGVTGNTHKEKFFFGWWINRATKIAFLRNIRVWYHSDFIFKKSSLYREQKELIDNITNFINKIIAEKRRKTKKDSERKDFLDLLLETCDQGNNFTDQELKDETLTFMVAASDTTATTTCFTLLMIAMHPQVQEKILQEVIDVLGPNQDVDYTHLPCLQYTQQVIKETLRLFPPVPLIARDIKKEIQLENVTLAENSSFLLAVFLIHRNPNYWPDPLKFDPDRFQSDESSKRNPYCYLPFGGGARACIGSRYAYMAIKTIIATIIRKYKLSTTYKRVDDVELISHIALRPKRDYNVKFEIRK